MAQEPSHSKNTGEVMAEISDELYKAIASMAKHDTTMLDLYAMETQTLLEKTLKQEDMPREDLVATIRQALHFMEIFAEMQTKTAKEQNTFADRLRSIADQIAKMGE
jgi:hypothetical protein